VIIILQPKGSKFSHHTLDKIRLRIALMLVSLAIMIVNKKTYEGFGLIITLKDWVDYCNLRQNTSSNKDKGK